MWCGIRGAKDAARGPRGPRGTGSARAAPDRPAARHARDAARPDRYDGIGPAFAEPGAYSERVSLPTSIPSPSTGVLQLGPFPLRAYAVCIIIGVLVAVRIGQRRAEARGFSRGTVADMAVWAVPAGIVGARIYHVVTSPDAYFGTGGHPLEALAVWRGGLGIWGGVLGGALAAYVFCRRTQRDFLRLADAVAPAIAVAQAIGRVGNWFNQELFGGPSTLPWAVRIDPGRDGTVPGALTYHPTFLYELLWDLAVAALCVGIGRRWSLRRGQVFAAYVALYTLGRGPIEALRSDPAHTFLGLRVNDYVSIGVFLAAAAAFVLLGRRREPVAGPFPVSDAAQTRDDERTEVAP